MRWMWSPDNFRLRTFLVTLEVQNQNLLLPHFISSLALVTIQRHRALIEYIQSKLIQCEPFHHMMEWLTLNHDFVPGVINWEIFSIRLSYMGFKWRLDTATGVDRNLIILKWRPQLRPVSDWKRNGIWETASQHGQLKACGWKSTLCASLGC